MNLAISLALILFGMFFLILGLIIVSKGDVWGIMFATIGLPLFGTVLAFCLYEPKRKKELKDYYEDLNEKLDILLFESNIKKAD
ncbi:hypothetical protein [Spiroplasma cantharicola]|uniref:Uncharacterized protein n=1 Tax=Spiroplasma cantharicola TaxID=362837 RepID=A0A0M4JSN4_9MOLU|nr:hypothetical protein [Spiroplasma cantharicola]ALD66597.1 hypothetical protein SCANT_v1c06910 [Spiroplasma cantharicola]